VVTISTTCLNIKISALCAQIVMTLRMTTIISPNDINLLAFVTETK